MTSLFMSSSHCGGSEVGLIALWSMVHAGATSRQGSQGRTASFHPGQQRRQNRCDDFAGGQDGRRQSGPIHAGLTGVPSQMSADVFAPWRFGMQFRYLKVIKSVRLRVEAPFFNGSFVTFELC